RPLPTLPPGAPESVFEESDFFLLFAPVSTVRAKEDIDIFQEMPEGGLVRENIGWIRIGFSKDTMKKNEREIVFRSVLLGTAFSAVSSIAAFILITLATKPLTLLFNAVKKMEKGEYPEIGEIKSNDEIGVLAEAFDRTSLAIKDREVMLKASEKRIRELFERVEHAIFRLDKEGNIVETNRKFDELCGGITRFCDLFDDAEMGKYLTKASSEKITNIEAQIIDMYGNEKVAMMSLYPDFRGKSELKGIDGYFVDITEKKRLEEILIQSQKLDSLGLLAGGIAHDFNNILTGITGYSSLLKSMMSEADSRYKYLDTIEKSAMRATLLTQQLLGFARKGKYMVEKININDLVNELSGFLKETFDRNIIILTDCEEPLPPVDGDSNQLYQTFMNICINARDAMPNGGRLYIRTEHYTIHEMKNIDYAEVPKGDYVRISVTDTGSGMTEEVKKKMFEPFYTTKEFGKGSGLGLAMAYGIIKNHNGHISVYSEQGLGTTVRVYMPAAGDVAKEKRGEGLMDKEAKKGTILVIDDEEIVRELGKDILEAHDFKVLLAPQGMEGVRIFMENKDKVDLVILDMVMPEKSGKQTFEEIRAIKPDAKVLLCSGYGQEQYFHELFEEGASGFLQKPFRLNQLLGKVEEALEK
ncbi:MAG: response regulator, partial [Nitrospirota bacterium]|nr:response regulator [Nitrospirota bacterium]